MPNLTNNINLEPGLNELDTDISSGGPKGSEPSTTAVRSEHVEKEALSVVRAREGNDPKGLPGIFKQGASAAASQDLKSRLQQIADIEGDEKVQDSSRFQAKEDEVARQQVEAESRADARAEEEGRRVTTKQGDTDNSSNGEARPRQQEVPRAEVDRARQEFIDQVESEEKVQDNILTRATQAETEKLKEQNIATVEDGASLASRQSGGDGTNGKASEAQDLVSQGRDESFGSRGTAGTSAAEQRQDLINQVEADEKVEDNNRARSNQQETAKLREGIEGQNPRQDLSLRQGESSTDGSQSGFKGAQDGASQSQATLSRPKLLRAKPADNPTKQAQKETKQVQKEKQAEQLREISEGELSEKVEDQSAKNQRETQEEQRHELASQANPQAEETPSGNEQVVARGGRGDSSTSGGSSGEADKASVEPSVAVRSDQNSKNVASNENREPDSTSLEDQQNRAALKARKQMEAERDRLNELGVTEIDLSAPYGFSPDTSAELHRDARDIRVLLVMADAYKRMREHIERDVLAANVAADGAASFEAANIEAVRVASERFREQVGDVQPWQRFGAN